MIRNIMWHVWVLRRPYSSGVVKVEMSKNFGCAPSISVLLFIINYCHNIFDFTCTPPKSVGGSVETAVDNAKDDVQCHIDLKGRLLLFEL